MDIFLENGISALVILSVRLLTGMDLVSAAIDPVR